MSDKYQKQLKKVIKKMKQLQKKIAKDGQPASQLELQALADLGRKYAKIIEKMNNI